MISARCSYPPGSTDDEDKDFYYNLGIAAAVFLAVSFMARVAVSLGTIIKKRSEIEGINEWLWVILGTIVSIFHPWNGGLVGVVVYVQGEHKD